MRRVLFVIAACTAVSCTSAGSGCFGVEPLPTRYAGPRVESGLSARVSPRGFSTLNQDWQRILRQFLPGQTLTVPLPCDYFNVPLVGTFAYADEGSVGCTSEACGRLDGVCDTKDAPRSIPITVTGLRLSPRPPDSVELSLDIQVATGKVMVDSVSRNHALCLLTSPIKCSVDFDTRRATPGNNSFHANLKLTIDSRWDQQLRIRMTSMGGTDRCGTSGALPKPACLDTDDVLIAHEGSCITCEAAQVAFLKNIILDRLAGEVEKALDEAVRGASCQSCPAAGPACPSTAGASSSCLVPDGGTSGLCIDPGTQDCVPRLLGLEGRLDPARTFADLGLSGLPLDLSAVIGGRVTVDTGLDLSMRTGARTTAPADCVPTLPAPTLAPVPPPAFDAEAKVPYDVGLSLSRQTLNLALHGLHQGGLLCVQLPSARVPKLTVGLLEPLVPSLGKLARVDGRDAPMMVVLRPLRPAAVEIGEGTYDPITGKPIQPLLELTVPELRLDFYAQLEDRQVRAFTLAADVAIPVSLLFEGCGQIRPVLGNLEAGAVTNVQVENHELLAEDRASLEKLVPLFLAFADQGLGAQLKPFTLPEVGDFKLKVHDARGVTRIAGTGAYEHVGLFASLALPASCAVSAPMLQARLVSVERPSLGTDGRWALPAVTVELSASGVEGKAELAVRVDSGAWSEFSTAEGLRYTLRHPSLLLQGPHVIELRVRGSSLPAGISAPVRVDAVVDYQPPSVAVRADRAKNLLWVDARDSVTPASRLAFSYRLGAGGWSPFGPARPVDLAAVEAAGGLEVRVRDEAGLEGAAQYAVPRVAERAEPSGEEPSLSTGCAAGLAGGPTAESLGLVLAGWMGARRRRRARTSAPRTRAAPGGNSP